MFDNYTLYDMYEREMDKRKNNVCEENVTVQDILEHILSSMIVDNTVVSIYNGPCLLEKEKYSQLTSKYDSDDVFDVDYTTAFDKYGEFIDTLNIYL